MEENCICIKSFLFLMRAKKSMFTKRGSGVSRAVLSKNRAKAPKRAKVQKRKR